MITKYFGIAFICFLFIAYLVFGINTAMLCFCLFWQVIIAIGAVKSIRVIWKTRNGVFLSGEAAEVSEVRDSNGNVLYDVVIKYIIPGDNVEYQLKYLSKYRPHDNYKIWLDQKNPEKSIITNDHTGIVINNLFFLAVIAFLGYVDYQYILKIFYNHEL